MDTRDELDLARFLLVIWKRRGVFACGMVACAALAAAYWFLAPPAFEAHVLVRVGRVWGEPVENVYQLSEVMNSDSFLERVREKAQVERSVKDLRDDKALRATVVGNTNAPPDQTTGLVRVVTRARTPGECVRLAQTAGAITIENHLPRYEEMIGRYREYETKLTVQSGNVEREIAQLENLVRAQSEKPDVDAPAVILLQAQLEQKHVQLVGIERELRDVRVKNSSKTMSENTKAVAAPVLPERPTNPGLPLCLLIAVVGGVVPVVALTFFLEYFEKARKLAAPRTV